jgi:hypothetical protein
MPVSRTSPRLTAPFAALVALLALAFAAAPAEGAKLGQTARTPTPACPKSPCQAIGRTTAIQLVADGQRAPFKARKDGDIVGWALDLSRPTKKQRSFFSDFFQSNALGMRPTARIAVLKRKGKGRNYKLKRQGPVVDLSSSLGSYEVFTLTDPLRIRKGEFLGISVPTWMSAFAVDLNRTSNIWRASRSKGGCTSEQDIKKGKAQQKVGSVREYGCDYSTARVLYWGFYKPRGGGGGGGGGGGSD